MNALKTQGFDLHCQPLCKVCHDETQTMHIYLTSGALIELGNADKVRVEGDTVAIECVGEGAGHEVEFRRKDVYFVTCGNCLPHPE
jgi:hypothetical protein